MRRRQFVTAAGVVLTGALAGCVGSDDDDDDDGTDEDDEGVPPADLERVDEPPHGPERPPDPDDPGEWDQDWPGEGMATGPSVEFERVSVRLDDRQLTELSPGESVYAVSLITDSDQLGSRVDMSDPPDRLATVDFDEEVVVIVESGFGSSTVDHVWKRVESVGDGLHLHGYHTDPIAATTDVSPRHSVLVVEASPAAVERAYASLTIGENERVNVHSGEGVVSVEDT